MVDSNGGDVELLTLDSVLTLRTAEDTFGKIHEPSARHVDIAIDCRDASEVDLSFVQMLLAARLSAMAAGRTVRLAHPASGALLDVLQRGGFVGTAAAPADQAFWLQPETV